MALASRWLLVVPALQRMPARVRSTPVARLRRLGAIRVRPSVFVLPDSPATREAVGWLKADVERSNGELTAFAADSVDAWTDERTARVRHRGTEWTARLMPGVEARSGEHIVSAVEGNWLILTPAAGV